MNHRNRQIPVRHGDCRLSPDPWNGHIRLEHELAEPPNSGVGSVAYDFFAADRLPAFVPALNLLSAIKGVTTWD